MRIPIRHQFLAPLALVATVSLLAIAAIDHRLATDRTRQRVETQLRSVVEVLTQRSYPLTESVLKQMRGLANAEFLLVGEGGVVLRASSMLPNLEKLPQESFVASDAEQLRLGGSVTLGSTIYLHAAVRLDGRVRDPGPSVLHILFPQRDYSVAWWSAFAPPLFIGFATLSAVSLVVHLVARRLSRELGRLGADVQRLAEGDFADVDRPLLDDEACDLANSVNLAARRLRDYENELRQTERLQAIATIGAGLAHEMRNAATGCRLAIDLHQNECEVAGASESLSVAQRQLALMEGRLQQLLQVGKPSEATEPKRIDLRSVVEETLQLVGPAIRHARVSCEWRAPEYYCVVEADPVLIRQAVMNLVLNAMHAAAKVSATDPGAGRIEVILDGDVQECRLRVIDNGAGPQVDQLSLFEPFATEKPEGVGLGLSVVKSVVESCGGDVAFRREEEATVFCVELPIAQQEPCHA